MPVIDRQRQLRQLGMIRLGYSAPGRNGGKTPKRSDTIILTSPSRETLEGAARVFGGTVSPFPQGERDKFSLVTTRTEIEIGVTQVAPSQWMEHWDKGACQVRCNGQKVCGPRGSALLGKPCLCKIKYPDPDDRYAAAKARQACKIVTRVNVMIPDAPDIGVWRMDTRGEHAADELITTLGIIQHFLECSPGVKVVPCIFAIEWRKNVDGQPYPVPVIRLQQTYREVSAQIEAEQERLMLTGQGRGQAVMSGEEQRQLETAGVFDPEDDTDDDNNDDVGNAGPDDPDGIFTTKTQGE